MRQGEPNKCLLYIVHCRYWTSSNIRAFAGCHLLQDINSSSFLTTFATGTFSFHNIFTASLRIFPECFSGTFFVKSFSSFRCDQVVFGLHAKRVWYPIVSVNYYLFRTSPFSFHTSLYVFFYYWKKLFLKIKGVRYDVDVACLICSRALCLRSPDGWRITLRYIHPICTMESRFFICRSIDWCSIFNFPSIS